MIIWVLIAHLNTSIGGSTDAYIQSYATEASCEKAITKWQDSYPRKSALRCTQVAVLP